MSQIPGGVRGQYFIVALTRAADCVGHSHYERAGVFLVHSHSYSPCALPYQTGQIIKKYIRPLRAKII
jgi:hypothetical protein